MARKRSGKERKGRFNVDHLYDDIDRKLKTTEKSRLSGPNGPLGRLRLATGNALEYAIKNTIRDREKTFCR